MDVRSRQPESRATSRSGSFDFPRRVVRDVHRKIIAGASQRRHSYASKWLAPGDPLILSGTAGDDMGSAVHLRLGLVEIRAVAVDPLAAQLVAIDVIKTSAFAFALGGALVAAAGVLIS